MTEQPAGSAHSWPASVGGGCHSERGEQAATLSGVLSAPAITIDVEDWPESCLDSRLPVRQRAARNTEHVLDILRENRVKATMFILGKMAAAFPRLVRDIGAEGHEIGCHDHGHVQVFCRDQSEFRVTVGRCKAMLEDLVGAPVWGYRAPDFSIVRGSLWALETLAEVGFTYDSSIFPAQGPRYGIAEWPAQPVRVQLANGLSIVEIPVGVFPLLGRNWPIGGGGYQRLLPGAISRFLMRRVLKSSPFVFYCHPYEFDPNEFRETDVNISLKRRFHQGFGRSRFERRFRLLLKRFGGRRICDVLSNPESLKQEIALARWLNQSGVSHASSG